MFLFILLFLIFVAFLWHRQKFSRHNYLLSKIPSPKKYPILHHSPNFFGKNASSYFYYLEKLNQELGDVFYFSFGSIKSAVAVVSDAKIVEELLTNSVEIDKTAKYEFLVPWLGRGLLISSDKKWFQRRKLLTPGFHFQILEKFVETMDRTSSILAEKLESLEGEVDFYPLGKLYALDTVCECAMAEKLNSQILDSPYAKAVKGITSVIINRFFNPILAINFFYQFTNLCKVEKELIKKVHTYTHDIIESRREELLKLGSENLSELAESKKKALIDILLTSTIDGVPLTNEDIREEVDTFLFAGHDTTTSALRFIFFNIAKYPEVQQKIYEEINEIFVDGKLSLNQLNNMRYTELVIKESLRLFPPVPYYGRKLKSELTAGGITFPANISILVSPYLMGRSKKYFDDPEVFKPERFEAEKNFEKLNPFAFVPFSAGPRNCIGQKFAVLTLKSAIVKVVTKFKILLGKKCDDPPILINELALRPANGIFIKLEKRL